MAGVKRRLRTLETRLHQVMEVTIPHDMDRLQSQRCAIEQSQREGDWEALRRDQRNATLTIKVTVDIDSMDLKTHVQLLEELREEVREEELAQFDRMVEPTRSRVVEAVMSFLQIDPALSITTAASPAGKEPSDEYMMVNMGPSAAHSSEKGAEEWREMEQELRELRDIASMLGHQVSDQSSLTDQLEDHVSSAQASNTGATYTLLQSLRAKTVTLPVGAAIVGGVIGGVVGGPIGAIAGLKIGALGAIAGGTAGAVGGGWIGYRRRRKLVNSLQPQDPKTD